MRQITDFDSPWKNILEALFKAFTAFFLPDAHAEIDWSQKPVFLDKEMQAISPRGARGRRFVDKLVRVVLKSGADAQVLVHVEVQASPEAEVSERMYVYNYRSFDRYKFRVASVLVLLDDHATWRPASFGYDLWATELRFKYPVIKLADWAARREELERSPNPFATVVLAQFEVRRAGTEPGARLESKWALVRRLFRRGIGRDAVESLLRFIDGLIALPEDLVAEFWHRYNTHQEGKNMPQMLSIERLAMKEGAVTSFRTAILDSLRARFGRVPSALTREVGGVTDQGRLRSLIRDAALAASLEEFESALANPSPPRRSRRSGRAPVRGR